MTIITPPQAAQIANVHQETIKRWLHNPQRDATIKWSLTDGGRYVIDEDSFRAYLAAPVKITNTAWSKKAVTLAQIKRKAEARNREILLARGTWKPSTELHKDDIVRDTAWIEDLV